jgi:hypothetical protein
MRHLGLAVFWLSLTLWVSAVVAAGVTATASFVTLPKQDLTMHDYDGADPDTHGALAAGLVAAPVFRYADIAQVVLAPITTIMLVWLLARSSRPRSIANILRTVCIAAAVGLVAWRVLLIMPVMNRQLEAYHAAAAAGDASLAAQHRASFEMHHPQAARMYNVTLWLLLAAVVTSAMAPGWREENA